VYRRGTGQFFSLAATDDAWVFVGGVLAIDLGGTHPRLEARVDLDQLADRVGFRDGQVLPVRVFVANRRAGRSDLDIRTNLMLDPDSTGPERAR
jgi:fibro-slime domain-containing protein